MHRERNSIQFSKMKNHRIPRRVMKVNGFGFISRSWIKQPRAAKLVFSLRDHFLFCCALLGYLHFIYTIHLHTLCLGRIACSPIPSQLRNNI